MLPATPGHAVWWEFLGVKQGLKGLGGHTRHKSNLQESMENWGEDVPRLTWDAAGQAPPWQAFEILRRSNPARGGEGKTSFKSGQVLCTLLTVMVCPCLGAKHAWVAPLIFPSASY